MAKDGMYGVANRPNGTAHKYFASAPYKIAAKSGTRSGVRPEGQRNL
ncbi:hypothetical protein MJ389_08160 [Escherichia coli]|nr:hypothetical protein MJ389_08160 [Escherichia coli]